MSNDWKPGDLAMVRFGSGDIEPAMLMSGGKWYSTVDTCWDSGGMEPVRPLVVIDPENPEEFTDVALCHIENRLALDDDDRDYITEGLAAALREFANPTSPKPDEPTGLGAVVEDADGNRWVRTEPAPSTVANYWQPPWTGAADAQGCEWSDVPALRVLSEGVTP